MSDQATVHTVMIALPVVAVVLLILVTWLIARLRGWDKLDGRFPDRLVKQKLCSFNMLSDLY